jgi:hypothetical protein
VCVETTRINGPVVCACDDDRAARETHTISFSYPKKAPQEEQNETTCCWGSNRPQPQALMEQIVPRRRLHTLLTFIYFPFIS